MTIWMKYEIHKIVAYKGGDIYKTECIGTIWKSLSENTNRQDYFKETGNLLVNTIEERFCTERPVD